MPSTLRQRRTRQDGFFGETLLVEQEQPLIEEQHKSSQTAVVNAYQSELGLYLVSIPKRVVDGVVDILKHLWYYMLPSREEFLKSQLAVQEIQITETIRTRMDKFKSFVSTQYDTNNTDHEVLLFSYWSFVYPNIKLESRMSNQWKDLGFQNKDPASDFRGAGIFGLCNLLYFYSRYSQLFEEMFRQRGFRSVHKESYPFSIAGLNVSMLILDFLGWGFKRIPRSTKSKNNLVALLFSEERELELPLLVPANLIHFDDNEPEQLIPSFPEKTVFEELYCFVFRILDEEWYSMEASYMDFPKVIESTSNKFEKSLEKIETFDQILELNRTPPTTRLSLNL